MHEELLPLFPLAVVLLPKCELPLHIFEERYKEMIGLAIAHNTEFGIVLAADQGIARIGCTAGVDRVLQEYPDGRLDIMTSGRRRFSISAVDQEKAYLRGNVTFFDDEEMEASADLRRKAVALCAPFSGEPAPSEDDHLLSYRLAAPLTDLDFRQELLMLRSEPERLRRLIEFAPGYLAKLQETARIRELAPRNGHSRLPKSAN